MKKILHTLFILLSISQLSYGQQYAVSITPYPQLIKADPRLILQTGYLVVPENRSKPNGRKVKLPFFFVRRPDQDASKMVSLYMTGGPGYSTIDFIDSISYNSGFLRYGGFIAIDQRGTRKAQPCLECFEVDAAIKQSYRENKNKDSLIRIAARQCREKLLRQGIDLSAYNTTETVEDINDLRLALHIDSLNLVGISYSCGLMMAVAKNHPEAVRALILNSPLPSFTRYEEEAMFNINEALEQVFTNTATDSLDKPAYADLRDHFHQYFTDIQGRKFSIRYLEKGHSDSIDIIYTKNELLDAVLGHMNNAQINAVPAVINDIINGSHQAYIKEVLDGYFTTDTHLSMGMRYSVYCSEQIQYSNPALVKQQDKVLPWLAGYAFNNVDHPVCDCWKVNPAPKTMKDPLYSSVPALISAGDIDRWCRPFYNRLIKRYLPNSQLLILHNKGHGAGFAIDGVSYVDGFISEPYKKLVSQSKNLIVE